jgi:hypothetical protein
MQAQGVCIDGLLSVGLSASPNIATVGEAPAAADVFSNAKTASSLVSTKGDLMKCLD